MHAAVCYCRTTAVLLPHDCRTTAARLPLRFTVFSLELRAAGNDSITGEEALFPIAEMLMKYSGSRAAVVRQSCGSRAAVERQSEDVCISGNNAHISTARGCNAGMCRKPKPIQ